ncbi:MAG: hypothetical protein AB7M12_01235 [Hyphomonadaceae bacterium]
MRAKRERAAGRGLAAFIQGVAASVSWAERGLGLGDLIFRTVTAALADAGRTIGEVETLVLAAHDLIDGRSLSSMVTAPAAGAYLKDEIRLAEDGLAAVSLAAAQVEAGQSPLVIVAAWGRASEVDFPSHARAAFDPAFAQPFGLTEAGVSAMRLSAWLARYGDAGPARAEAAAARLRRAARNPLGAGAGAPWPIRAYPLRDEEMPRAADIVAAMLIGAAPGKARIRGVGHGTDVSDIGARDLLALPSLRAASDGALRAAGCALEDISAFEMDGFALSDEALAMEAAGLAAPGEGFAAYAAHTAFNRSGGGAAGWCYPAIGLLRLHDALGALKPGELALAAGASPVGAQAHVAVVAEAA